MAREITSITSPVWHEPAALPPLWCRHPGTHPVATARAPGYLTKTSRPNPSHPNSALLAERTPRASASCPPAFWRLPATPFAEKNKPSACLPWSSPPHHRLAATLSTAESASNAHRFSPISEQNSLKNPASGCGLVHRAVYSLPRPPASRTSWPFSRPVEPSKPLSVTAIQVRSK